METSARKNNGFHSVAEDQPYLFVDSCMQIWPDADFANAHRHGVTAYAVTAWRPRDGLADVLQDAMDWHRVVRQHRNLMVAETVEELRAAKRDGKAALIIAAQGGDWIEAKLHRVEAFQRLGLRMMLLAYNASNLLCDGCLDRTASGLTRFGELVVDECDRVGVVLDGSHTGKRSTLEIIDRSKNPTVFSHSNPSALAPNPRNIDDEQIKACAARGGVIGLANWAPLVMRSGAERPTIEDFIDHIDYVAQLTGATDAIGIGTDMSLGSYPEKHADLWGEPAYGNPSAEYGRKFSADPRSPLRYVEGFDDYAQVVNLIERLRQRGYSEADVRKILGENFLRVFSQVWKPN